MASISPDVKKTHRSAGVRRLLQEAAELSSDDCPDYNAAPLETDLFDWHFTIRGLSGSQFEGGIYHGRMILPSEYPFKPPEIYLLTPSGRFEVNRKICLSISSFHPETWQPSWGVRTALLALISFFESDPKGAVGSLNAPPEERKRLANASKHFKCSTCGYDAADCESFSALPSPGPSIAVEERETAHPETDTKEGADAELEIAELSDINFTSSNPAPSRERHPVLDEPSIPPATIFPTATSAPRNYSQPRAGAVESSPIADAGPHAIASSRNPRNHGPELCRAQFAPIAAQVAPALSSSDTASSITPRSPQQPLAPPARQQSLTPSRIDSPLAQPGTPDVEFVEAGSPSYIDRAILATLLAIVALIVRKVA